MRYCACQHQTSVLQDDVLPHTRLPPCEVGRVHEHMHLISNSPLILLCKVLATMFRYYYVFVILKPIQTKISVCFNPIIYPPGSHQLAGRWVCLQLHMDSWCVPSEVAIHEPPKVAKERSTQFY